MLCTKFVFDHYTSPKYLLASIPLRNSPSTLSTQQFIRLPSSHALKSCTRKKKTSPIKFTDLVPINIHVLVYMYMYIIHLVSIHFGRRHRQTFCGFFITYLYKNSRRSPTLYDDSTAKVKERENNLNLVFYATHSTRLRLIKARIATLIWKTVKRGRVIRLL